MGAEIDSAISHVAMTVCWNEGPDNVKSLNSGNPRVQTPSKKELYLSLRIETTLQRTVK
jgi:hypothetical protein